MDLVSVNILFKRNEKRLFANDGAVGKIALCYHQCIFLTDMAKHIDMTLIYKYHIMYINKT